MSVCGQEVHMKGTLSAVLLIILTMAVSLNRAVAQNAAATPTPAASSPDSQLGLNGPVRAEDVFKDIETFKGKPATTVLIAMNAIRGNLGVSCTYCHTQYQWENNDKPAKQT